MAAYTKDFLVGAYLSRFYKVATDEQFAVLERDANRFFDEAGRDKFRLYASLDAEALRKYRLEYC